jgi:hypothetical protein
MVKIHIKRLVINQCDTVAKQKHPDFKIGVSGRVVCEDTDNGMGYSTIKFMLFNSTNINKSRKGIIK